jgi:hypothetical protein
LELWTTLFGQGPKIADAPKLHKLYKAAPGWREQECDSDILFWPATAVNYGPPRATTLVVHREAEKSHLLQNSRVDNWVHQ